MLRSLGFGLGLKFFMISVSKNLVSEKSIGFGFETFANFLRVSVSVLENLVSEKKSRYRFRKIWYRKKSLGIGFGQNFGIVIQCLLVCIQYKAAYSLLFG